MTKQGSRGGRDNLVELVLAACRADELMRAGGALVVAFSGGPDSTAMLHALSRSSGALSLRLHAVHVDHGLRPASAEQAARAARFAAELGVEVEVVGVRPRGTGEDAARRVRHAALERVALRQGAHSIALGHTAGDQAETVLLHLLRGSGVAGLGAMSRRDGLRFRPLLDVTREQVDAYCGREGLAPELDESNNDMAFTRNRVRHELIPLLEARFNPRVQEALARLARAARDAHEVVRMVAGEWLSLRAGALPRREFVALPAAVQVEVLRTAWAAASGAAQIPGGAARIEQALRLVRTGRSGMIQLGAGFELLADVQQLRIRPVKRPLDGPRKGARILTEP